MKNDQLTQISVLSNKNKRKILLRRVQFIDVTDLDSIAREYMPSITYSVDGVNVEEKEGSNFTVFESETGDEYTIIVG